MHDLVPLHFFPLPQTEELTISTYTILNLTCGKKKMLVGTRKGKIFLFEFFNDGYCRVPLTNEVSFSGITAEKKNIQCIDAFNKSQTSDYFVIGMTTVKEAERREVCFHIYQDIERAELDIDSLAQNCLLIQLSYSPTFVKHTLLLNFNNMTTDNVWILPGCEQRIHVYREDQNHIYQEVQSELYFPEFSKSKVVYCLDIKYTSNFQRRLTALGNSDGTIQCFVMSTLDGCQINYFTKNLISPVWDVEIFTTHHTGVADFHLVAATMLGASVFMDITQPAPIQHNLRGGNGSPYRVCVADINRDSKDEILIGTHDGLLVYFYMDNTWKLESCHRIPFEMQFLRYIDFTGSGIKQLIVLTRTGVSILQHQAFLQGVERQLQALQL